MYINRDSTGHHCLPKKLLQKYILRFGSGKYCLPYRFSSDYTVVTKENTSEASLLKYNSTFMFQDIMPVLSGPPFDDPISTQK